MCICVCMCRNNMRVCMCMGLRVYGCVCLLSVWIWMWMYISINKHEIRRTCTQLPQALCKLLIGYTGWDDLSLVRCFISFFEQIIRAWNWVVQQNKLIKGENVRIFIVCMCIVVIFIECILVCTVCKTCSETAGAEVNDFDVHANVFGIGRLWLGGGRRARFLIGWCRVCAPVIACWDGESIVLCY